MTIQSQTRRLRLFILSLSLFCSGVSAAQSIDSTKQPPDIEVLSAKWVMYVFKPGVSVEPAIGSETIQRDGRANEPMPVVVPNPTSSAKPIERRSYMYSAEVVNRGQKVIKALKWTYLFSHRVTHQELKRLLTFNDTTIRPAEKKTLQFRTSLSPPMVVNADSPNAASPFEERVVIECVLFADGSLWTNPQAKAGLCDNLRGYKR